ncbi:hypothetical protein [Qipengyuania oceanensis]|uniref:Uncharacterized protein n=1 Tax=Qipengyuania oceanensis TaxID=1463597 RepID=A0A844YJ89_9SPHN|nr:hypothetical protein [Qipengyuania oceanensis]MXO63118.1 hypothetical protein [Qipengyuania oceanensis]
MAAAYSSLYSLAILNDRGNPEFAAMISPLLNRSAAQKADIRIVTAGQEALEAAGQRLEAGQVPPSLFTGIGLDLSESDRRYIENAALSGLEASPLTPGSLRQLAFLSDSTARREKFLRLSQRVSKRDVFGALQLAEMDLRKNDLDAGMAGLNRALVVSTRLDSAIFPVLMGAASMPGFKHRVGKLIADGPVWDQRMMDWVLANPQYLPAAAPLIGYLDSGSPARDPGYGQQFVDILSSNRNYAEAFEVYESFNQERARAADLTRTAYAPIDWRPIDNYDSGSRIFDDGVLEFFANPARQGPVLQRIMRLPPGAYTVSLKLAEEVGSDAALIFSHRCVANEGPELPFQDARQSLSNGVKRFRLVIGSGCPFQELEFRVAAGNDAASVLVERLVVERHSPGASQTSDDPGEV